MSSVAVHAHNKTVVFGVYRDLLRAIGFAFKGAYAMSRLQHIHWPRFRRSTNDTGSQKTCSGEFQSLRAQQIFWNDRGRARDRACQRRRSDLARERRSRIKGQGRCECSLQ